MAYEEAYYSLPPDEVLKLLETSRKGLAKGEAERRVAQFGYNEIEKEKGATAFKIFVGQFTNPMIILLLFAGIISLFLHEILESFAIFFIIMLNAILGFVQEYRAEKAVEALQKISAPTARVLRDGEEQRIAARSVVPGDILIIEAGDIVPADARLIAESSLQIEEASLTGESVPAKKIVQPVKSGVTVSDQVNMAFMSTVVTYGKGVAVVTKTGMGTEFGKIAKTLASVDSGKTPLQYKFERLAKQIGIMASALIFLVFIIGILNRTLSFPQMLLFALALTVAIIPNSLPLVVTVGLSIGTKRLAKRNMLIKKLPAAESLGSATIICSDKTGTITKNEMTVTRMFMDDLIVNVTGTGYEPQGSFHLNGEHIGPERIEMLLRICVLCNNAKLIREKGGYGILGDPTEGALIVLGQKGGISPDSLRKRFHFVEELPFDSDRKRMSVIFRDKASGKTEAYVKGAPDLLLDKCSMILKNGKVIKLTSSEKKRIHGQNHLFATDALRCLGMAYKEVTGDKHSIISIEKGLIFVGLVGMIDPPREEIRYSVDKCRTAGILVMMITGDHATTAKAISKQIGLYEEGDLVLTGDDIGRMSDSQLRKTIHKVRIIARALPIQKSRIVDALKANGHVVAMTGDGVNDAPALKKADIGIAMGITGTDVTKEVAKATLVDDNFSTIVNAIEEGRDIYDKMIRSAKFLLACNAGEIVAVFLAVMLRFPLPILPLQMLLMNLLTDDLPALGLGFESSEEGIMKRRPRNPKASPISVSLWISIGMFGLIMGLGTLYVFIQHKDADLVKAQTMAFTTLIAFQMFAVLSSRSLMPSFKKLNPFSNLWLLGAVAISVVLQLAVIYWHPLQIVFGTVSLALIDWIWIIGISALGFVIMEASKFALEFIDRRSA